MSIEGDNSAAVLHESIEITEEATRLMGLGAKNLAALLLAFARSHEQVAGATKLRKLILSGDELTVFPVKADDMDKFRSAAKQYGILFSAVRHKEQAETADIVAKVKDAGVINRILEEMGYLAPTKEGQPEKKENARAPSDDSSRTRGNGSTPHEAETSERSSDDKPSVKGKLAQYRDMTEDAPTKLKEAEKAVQAAALAATKWNPER